MDNPIVVTLALPKDEWEHDRQFYELSRKFCTGEIIAIRCRKHSTDWEASTKDMVIEFVRLAPLWVRVLHKLLPFLHREAGSCGRHDLCRCGKIISSEAL